MPGALACRFGLMRWSCIARANGVPAGSPVISMSSCNWIGSLRRCCRVRARAPAGSTFLQTLVCYRLIDPGSEWRLHRQWFEHSAMADLLGEDYALVAKNALYRCLDKLLPHKAALFSHLRTRWQDLFATKFDVLLYDLTSTYFESPPPADEADKRRHGYRRPPRTVNMSRPCGVVVSAHGSPS